MAPDARQREYQVSSKLGVSDKIPERRREPSRSVIVMGTLICTINELIGLCRHRCHVSRVTCHVSPCHYCFASQHYINTRLMSMLALKRKL